MERAMGIEPTSSFPQVCESTHRASSILARLGANWPQEFAHLAVGGALRAAKGIAADSRTQHCCALANGRASASMCPTICLGERFVADMHAYKFKPPQRGDLILMKHSSSGALFVKRVIGIAGDTVGPGPGGTIMVKSQLFSPPAPCGSSVSPKQNPDPTDYPAFQSTTVSEGSFFVVGDNLANSYDSRIPEFGCAGVRT